MRLLLIILVALLALAMLPAWPYAAAWDVGYTPSGILFLLLIVLLFMAATGKRSGPPV
ncbi:MAG: DUF3309 domain-containing protein [Planctomycetota bacterium]|nr:MAG: DUF3309 domain-containing protein [Planctomycetota bacterium]